MRAFDARDVVARDPLVVATEEAEQWARRFAEVLRDAAAVERRRGGETRVAGCGHVRVTAAHAEPGDTELRGAEAAQAIRDRANVGEAVGVPQLSVGVAAR